MIFISLSLLEFMFFYRFLSSCLVNVPDIGFVSSCVFTKSYTFWEGLFITVKISTAFQLTFWAGHIFNAFFDNLQPCSKQLYSKHFLT